MKQTLLVAVIAATLLVACGGDDSSTDTTTAPAERGRVVEVSMTDMAFSPTTIDVAAGETITFVFTNNGEAVHEAVVGDMAQQESHHAEMAEMGDMGSDHSGMEGDHSMGDSSLHAVVVQPGTTAELTHTFDAAGPMLIGCHQPGHWEVGMRLEVNVA